MTEHSHGKVVRGLMGTPRSPLSEGRFGRIFRNLRPFTPEDADLVALAETMIENPVDVDDPQEASNIHEDMPAGFHYLAQFMDHDLTFDPVSQLDRLNDPDALVNFRTPRFDLDNMYGSGPADQVFLYDKDDRKHLLLDDTNLDLQRNKQGTALVGDSRNDENSVVANLHVAFVKYHNAVVDALGDAGDFDTASRIVRFHYQWLVLNDFLPKLVGQDLVDELLVSVQSRPPGTVVQWRGNLRFYRPRNRGFMPVEFAVAAYRFGHSMVTFDYSLNKLSDPAAGGVALPVFDVTDPPPDPPPPVPRDLRGGRALDAERHVAWFRFFDFPEVADPALRAKLQTSRAIDTQLAAGLGKMPATVGAALSGPKSLAERNLKRGKALGLPTGQHVAEAMGINDRLIIRRNNRRFPFSIGTGYTLRDGTADPTVPAIDPAVKTHLTEVFGNRTPLWYYILKEAELLEKGQRLGPVGGRIVAEVFIGLLLEDRQSYLNAQPGFRPQAGQFGAPADGQFGIVDLVRHAVNDPLAND